MVGTPAPAHVGPQPKLGGGQGPRDTLVNAVVGHLHDPHWQGTETLLHYRPRRHHLPDGGDCCLVEGIKAVAVFYRQLDDNASVVISVPMKEDHLRRLPSQVIIGLTQHRRLSLRGVELLLDG